MKEVQLYKRSTHVHFFLSTVSCLLVRFKHARSNRQTKITLELLFRKNINNTTNLYTMDWQLPS